MLFTAHGKESRKPWTMIGFNMRIITLQFRTHITYSQLNSYLLLGISLWMYCTIWWYNALCSICLQAIVGQKSIFRCLQHRPAKFLHKAFFNIYRVDQSKSHKNCMWESLSHRQIDSICSYIHITHVLDMTCAQYPYYPVYSSWANHWKCTNIRYFFLIAFLHDTCLHRIDCNLFENQKTKTKKNWTTPQLAANQLPIIYVLIYFIQRFGYIKLLSFSLFSQQIQ